MIKHSPFNVTISALYAESVETSVLGLVTLALGTAISVLARSFHDCGVGITSQMCNRVTNHGDMGIFSKPELG